MKPLFVQKTIRINAPVSKVWKVLTDVNLTRHWIRLMWTGFLSLESDWKLGSEVLWKGVGEKTEFYGKVLSVKITKLLEYNFILNNPEISKEEIITYELEKNDKYTILTISMGNFGVTSEHELCYPRALDGWKKALPTIKTLAESL